MQQRKHVVVVGGGTAGWMAASALAKLLPHACTVELIESAEIGIVGVGEATLPHLRAFVATLGLPEAEFMAATHATFKLGIEFRDFGKPGDAYLHPFGDFGRPLNDVPFLPYWLRMHAQGEGGEIFDYGVANVMAGQRRFAHPTADPDSLFGAFSYAYQFDATRFGPYLRGFAERLSVKRTEGRIVSVERDGETGNVAAVLLESGARIEGDLFVDCSGFRSLLLGEAVGEAWEDWSHWLLCDRAVALPCESPPGAIEPFTRCTAMAGGWRWRIPLRHRVGNGYVYSSAHLSDDAAADAILAAVEGTPLADPRVLRFKAGRRTRSWSHNVVAVGLASGFLEPLESTSIYLVQAAITQLIELFPIGRIEDGDRDEFNAQVDYEYDRIRDFLILHYCASSRDDSAFWRHVRHMPIPDSLAEKIELFRRAGRVQRYSRGLFLAPSWIAVMIGQGIVPQSWDQRADAADPSQLAAGLERLRAQIACEVATLPGHNAALGLPA
ncbi:tryptophan 7-halogenase [Sphingomonas psychrotolerans]|uniref:Tryptophan 7-halogenase n=1 Tax=Sphingomonas psychrotolerans TaxID=1327635 RepID=A0ABU3N963_9SPHN|nr:tryptophan halogenase family protein [Sphingomonas psychrotolerans]MDT8761050.1 tryptophan 7-halogenase [Sphingomonas psychrotolerans]